MKQQLICINCPRGCHLDVEVSEDGSLSVQGNNCPRGVTYATQELTAPRRVVTAVVATDSLAKPYLPVRTGQAFPKERIPELLNALYRRRVFSPVRMGDVVWANALDTGIDVVASASLSDDGLQEMLK